MLIKTLFKHGKSSVKPKKALQLVYKIAVWEPD